MAYGASSKTDVFVVMVKAYYEFAIKIEGLI